MIINESILSDPTLLPRFRSGDKEAFTAIYDQYYFLIYQYARRWLPNKQDAEDIAADTFFKLYQRRAQFESLENIAGFLKITCRNACFDFLKHEQVKSEKSLNLQQHLSEQQTPDWEWTEAQEIFLSLIYSEVDKLPSKMKEIFLLSFRDGLKPAEIAEKLQLKVRTVSNQKTSAIKLLKAAFSQSSLLLALLLLLD